MVRACSMLKKKCNGYRFLVGKPGGERPLGTKKCRLENNIRMALREIA
jgi:hypothetical protein